MDTFKFTNWLCAHLNPFNWFNLRYTLFKNRKWDSKLKELIKSGKVTRANKYVVIIEGVDIWIEDYPYASSELISTHLDGIKKGSYPSKSTNRLLHKYLESLKSEGTIL